MGYTPLFGGFSPMTADGYGVCYAMLDGRMVYLRANPNPNPNSNPNPNQNPNPNSNQNVAITSWHSCAHTCSDRMRATLSAALCDMHTLFHAAEPAPKL